MSESWPDAVGQSCECRDDPNPPPRPNENTKAASCRTCGRLMVTETQEVRPRHRFIYAGLKVSCLLPETMMSARNLSYCHQSPQRRRHQQQPPRMLSPRLSHLPPARTAPCPMGPAVPGT